MVRWQFPIAQRLNIGAGNGSHHHRADARPVDTTDFFQGNVKAARFTEPVVGFPQTINGKLMVRPWRFNELKKDLDGISQKVLTDSLRSMEEDGIITRTVYPEVPPRVEYALSELGESMRPVIKSMEDWGIAYKNRL